MHVSTFVYNLIFTTYILLGFCAFLFRFFIPENLSKMNTNRIALNIACFILCLIILPLNIQIFSRFISICRLPHVMLIVYIVLCYIDAIRNWIYINIFMEDYINNRPVAFTGSLIGVIVNVIVLLNIWNVTF